MTMELYKRYKNTSKTIRSAPIRGVDLFLETDKIINTGSKKRAQIVSDFCTNVLKVTSRYAIYYINGKTDHLCVIIGWGKF